MNVALLFASAACCFLSGANFTFDILHRIERGRWNVPDLLGSGLVGLSGVLGIIQIAVVLP